jgi:hypothetical protein
MPSALFVCPPPNHGIAILALRDGEGRENPGAFASADYDGSCGVADGRGSRMKEAERPRDEVGACQKHGSGSARFDESRGENELLDDGRAGDFDSDRNRLVGAQKVTHFATTGRERSIWDDRVRQNDVDVPRGNLSVCQSGFGRKKLGLDRRRRIIGDAPFLGPEKWVIGFGCQVTSDDGFAGVATSRHSDVGELTVCGRRGVRPEVFRPGVVGADRLG